VGIASVGSLKASIGVGALLVCSDFLCPWDVRRVHADARAHVMPGFDERVREGLLAAVRGAGAHPLPAGVYANAAGPRFETKAEIRMMADYADVVGMTAAHEATAAGECGLPYGVLAMVDNYAHGVGASLTVDDFHAAQAANLKTLEACVGAVLEALPRRAEWVAAAAAAAAAGVPAAAAAAAAAPAPAPAAGGAGAMPPPPPAPPAPEPVDLLVSARWVVPCAGGAGREREVLDRHSIAVRGGRIVDILPTAEARGLYAPAHAVTLADDAALMPGLVNAHAHLGLSLLRGAADDQPLAAWLSETIWPAEAAHADAAFVAAGTRAALAECVRSGVTTVSDMYWFPGAAAEVVDAVGVRALLAMIVLEFPSAYAGGADEYLAKGLALRDAWAGRAGGRISWAFGPHAPYTVSDATLAKVAALSAASGARVHIHLHETAGEVAASVAGGPPGANAHLSDQRTSPLANLDRLGLVNDRLIAVHMTALEDADIARLARAGASVVTCPHSNLKLASGTCRVADLLAAGVNVGLGTDSAASNNALDMFAEMKTAALLAKGAARDATAVPAWQALRMATLGGARALGLDATTGSLELGKAADFIAVRLGGPDVEPLYSVLSALVYAAGRGGVTDVWVDGARLLDGRRLTTIDEAALGAETRAWAARVRPGGTAADGCACAAAAHRAPKRARE